MAGLGWAAAGAWRLHLPFGAEGGLEGGVYLHDAGGEGGTGNRLACKWDFWEEESWHAFSLGLS